MTVVLRAFASVRERAGWGRQEVAWEEGDTPLSLWERHVGGDRAGVAPAIGLSFTAWEAAVADGDEVAFVPPVAGG